MSALHADLTATRWQSLSLVEQLANVGSEVERAIKWSGQGRADFSLNAVYRGLELLEFTIADPRHRQRLRELTRLREALLDYFLGPNEFGSSDSAWRRYFTAFDTAAAPERHQARTGGALRTQPSGRA